MSTTEPTESYAPMTVLPQAEWASDSSSSVCPICNSAFGFFRRRHHCRFCGRVICYYCGQSNIIPIGGNANNSPTSPGQCSSPLACTQCQEKSKKIKKNALQLAARKGTGISPSRSSAVAPAKQPPQKAMASTKKNNSQPDGTSITVAKQPRPKVSSGKAPPVGSGGKKETSKAKPPEQQKRQPSEKVGNPNVDKHTVDAANEQSEEGFHEEGIDPKLQAMIDQQHQEAEKLLHDDILEDEEEDLDDVKIAPPPPPPKVNLHEHEDKNIEEAELTEEDMNDPNLQAALRLVEADMERTNSAAALLLDDPEGKEGDALFVDKDPMEVLVEEYKSLGKEAFARIQEEDIPGLQHVLKESKTLHSELKELGVDVVVLGECAARLLPFEAYMKIPTEEWGKVTQLVQMAQQWDQRYPASDQEGCFQSCIRVLSPVVLTLKREALAASKSGDKQIAMMILKSAKALQSALEAGGFSSQCFGIPKKATATSGA